jgi:hypothetical protein
MNEETLSVFVDESGILNASDSTSRFYILAFVFHDQSIDVSLAANDLDRDWDGIGLKRLCFHTAPIIRGNAGFEYMNWDMRRKIFSRMMGFLRRVDFKYHCLAVDKRYCNSTEQILGQLGSQFEQFMNSCRDFKRFDTVKVYYDCGQTPITNFLHQYFGTLGTANVEFARTVEPQRYKLLQIADFVCTMKLLEMKLAEYGTMSACELRFFGGVRRFRHNILRCAKVKEI